MRDELAYDNAAYEHSVIGSMTDLNAATVEDVAAFFKTYYAPNNAVVAIVGDVETKTTLEKVRKHFGSIPRQQPPPPVDMTEPPQTAERRTRIDDPLARLPRLDMAYKIPPAMLPTPTRWASWRRFSRGAAARASTKRSSVRSSCRQPYSPLPPKPADPACSPSPAWPRPGRTPADLEAAIDAEIEQDQEGADRRLGNREGAHQRALGARRQPRKLAVACDVTVPVRAVLRQAGQDQHTRRRHRESHRRGRSARRAALSGAGRPNRRR